MDVLVGVCKGAAWTDKIPQVRASAIDALADWGIENLTSEDRPDLAIAFSAILQGEADIFVQRVCLEAMVRFGAAGPEALDASDARILAAFDRILSSNEYLVKIKRWCAVAKEKLIIAKTPALKNLAEHVRDRLDGCPPGGSVRFDLPAQLESEEQLGRVLAHLAVDDFGLYADVKKGEAVVRRGEKFVFKTWRLLHELAHPSPDKRRNYSHTRGREMFGAIRAHSLVLGELTKTKTPGEPLVIWDEGEWRRHIPLLDDCLSLLHGPMAGKSVKIFSSAGATVVTPPPSIKARLAALCRLTLRYESVANLRNSEPGNRELPDIRDYIRALNEEGFVFSFRPHTYKLGNREVAVADPIIRGIFE
jgi:hypothetical protein